MNAGPAVLFPLFFASQLPISLLDIATLILAHLFVTLAAGAFGVACVVALRGVAARAARRAAVPTRVDVAAGDAGRAGVHDAAAGARLAPAARVRASIDARHVRVERAAAALVRRTARGHRRPRHHARAQPRRVPEGNLRARADGGLSLPAESAAFSRAGRPRRSRRSVSSPASRCRGLRVEPSSAALRRARARSAKRPRWRRLAARWTRTVGGAGADRRRPASSSRCRCCRGARPHRAAMATALAAGLASLVIAFSGVALTPHRRPARRGSGSGRRRACSCAAARAASVTPCASRRS